MSQRHALISVYDKTGIAEFAGKLVGLGWTIWSSGGTAKALREAGVAVTDVAELVGGGAILDHRVVTLSRELHAGLLARDNTADRAELERLNVPFINLVCVDLYPLQAEIARAGATHESVITKTDVGGPAMLRSAAKGGRIVICRPDQRQPVLDWLEGGEPDGDKFRQDLAATTEFTVAGYCLDSARYHSGGDYDGLLGHLAAAAKYGENAYQTPAALFAAETDDPLAIDRFELAAGGAPSFNNLAEVNRQLHTITHVAASFDRNLHHVPAIAIGTKHGNPCGAAVSDDPAEAIRRMVLGDPRAIFGGLVMVNFQITEALAEELLTHGVESGRRLLDAVTAPSFTPGAIKLLERKGDRCRFLVNPALASLTEASLDPAPLLRPVRGGFLRQPGYSFVADLASPTLAKHGKLTKEQQADLLLAWAIGATSNSNTVTLVRDGQLLGNGVGQQDRVGGCELAIKRSLDAGHNTKGAVAYSDSFFPFPDGPEVLIKAGVAAIWASSGSVKDQLTIDLCAKHDVALWLIPDAEGRGFFGH